MEELSARDLPIMSYNAFRCVTVDIITEFAFAKSRNLITSNDDQFSNDFLAAFDATAEFIWNSILSPTGQKIGNLLPQSLVKVMSPQIALILGMADHTTISYKDYKQSVPIAGKPVIFDGLQDLPDKLVISEAVNILIAGSDTTAWTLNVGVQQILAHEEHKHKLYAALREAYPSRPAELPSLTELEAIPYLTACIKESLRIAMPVRGRLPRVVPSQESGHYSPMIVDGGTIVPPGTVVGMSTYTMHYSETLWGPDARTFNSDRWLGEQSKGLDAYLCTFSKAARSCIGRNLAMAELYLMFTCCSETSRWRLKDLGNSQVRGISLPVRQAMGQVRF
ncbi:Putative cytochrome P450 [Septoria linicola]|uniref:Cytochrome P450 n=1 Tax=Septoria linicola TaxID=215465 RepID=A0A9Q9AJ74_9PEZI|nr:putative cytochrome P450 [Septoria linicola]USW47082.1 Putative cytochrome P450 [Septoria linicola]